MIGCSGRFGLDNEAWLLGTTGGSLDALEDAHGSLEYNYARAYNNISLLWATPVRTARNPLNPKKASSRRLERRKKKSPRLSTTPPNLSTPLFI